MILSFPFLTASFDADARAFVNTSGATDRAAINYFVKGIKRLGLWSSMVCWPLRSTQNAGTGSTAYSLGGLGTYNGTLVNGPTWGADGITLDGSNDYILANLPFNIKQSSVFQVNKIVNPASGFETYFGAGDASSISGSENLLIHQGSSFGSGIGITQSNQNIVENSTSNGSNFFAISFNGGATSFSGKTISGSNVTISGNYVSNACVNCGKLGIGCHFFVDVPVGNSNINVAINVVFQNSNVDLQNLVYPLYKTTLGQGLGLL
jgi:hypothetical protein